MKYLSYANLTFIDNASSQKVIRVCIYVLLRILGPIKALIIVRFFSLNDVGTFLFAFSIIQVAQSVCDLGLKNFFSLGDRQTRQQLITAGIILYIGIATFVTIFIYILSLINIANLSDYQLSYLKIITITVLLNSLYYPTLIVHSEGKFVRAALPKLFQEISTLLLLLIFYSASSSSYVALNGSLILGTTVGVVACWLISGPINFALPTLSNFKEVSSFGIPFIGFQFSNLFLHQIDKLALGYFRPAEDLAKYTPIYQAVFAIVGLSVVLEEMLVPGLRIFSKNSVNTNNINKFSSAWAFVCCLFGYSLWLEPMLFTKLFFGREIPELIFASKILGIALAAKGICGVGWLAIIYSNDRMRFLRNWSIINCIAMLLIGAPLIKLYGIDGAAVYWLVHTLFSILPTGLIVLGRSNYGLGQITTAVKHFITGTISCLIVSQIFHSNSSVDSVYMLLGFLMFYIALSKLSNRYLSI